MSARPELAQLPPEELDLLISRSLDGDLPPEEQEELESYLASDPDARRRRDAMASLVQSVRDLPEPEPPFALATRVNAQVSERAQGVAAAWNRLGVYPPPGVVPAFVVLALVAVVLSAVWAGHSPRRRAEPLAPADHEAPVRVFFEASSLRWNVELRGPGWKLAGTPVTRPEAPIDATYHLTLDPGGRVASLRPLTAGANIRPDVAQLLHALTFQRTAPADAGREVDVRIVAR